MRYFHITNSLHSFISLYNKGMSVISKPKTTLGNWSVRTIGTSILFFILFFAIVASGQRGGDTIFSNLWLAIPMLAAAILAISSFFTGTICIVRNRERSILVFLSTIFGFFVLLYVLAEIMFPH